MRVVAVTASYSGLQGLMPVAELQAIVRHSVSHWNSELNHCCAIRLDVRQPVSNWLAVEDATNLIALRRQQWCHNERCGNRSTFPLGTLAMTTVYPEGATGTELREADIEVDARQLHAVVAVADSPGPNSELLRTSSGYWVLKRQGDAVTVPLEVVLTHELGHVLGLKDACVSGYRTGGQPVLGQCLDEQRTRIMYADARLLRPTNADLAEIAEMYPLSSSDLNHRYVYSYLAHHPIFPLVIVLLCGAVGWRLIRKRK